MEQETTLDVQFVEDCINRMLQAPSTEAALRDGPRKFVALAAEIARGQFDPAVQWDEFVQALWEQVDAGFGLTGEEEDLGASLAWFEEPGDAEVVVWDARSDER